MQPNIRLRVEFSWTSFINRKSVSSEIGWVSSLTLFKDGGKIASLFWPGGSCPLSSIEIAGLNCLWIGVNGSPSFGKEMENREVWFEVCFRLKTEMLFDLAQVSKFFEKLLRNDIVWKAHYLSLSDLDPDLHEYSKFHFTRRISWRQLTIFT